MIVHDYDDDGDADGDDGDDGDDVAKPLYFLADGAPTPGP